MAGNDGVHSPATGRPLAQRGQAGGDVGSAVQVGRGVRAVAIAALALAWVVSRLGRVEVTGRSMAPVLEPGDRLLVLRPGGPWRRPRAGDVVAVADPRTGAGGGASRELVKRVAGVDDRGVTVRGDNPAFSTDSRTFGAVPRAAVGGRAVYRYHPPERVGRL